MNAINPPAVVSRESTEEGAEEVVYSNVTIVNALFDQLVHVEEIAPDALLSYYVDYYLAEVCNGGFSQFVFNTRWNTDVNTRIRAGLQAMGALEHLAIWDRSETAFTGLTDEQRARFVEDFSLTGVDPSLTAILESVDDEVYDVEKRNPLSELNAAWLLTRPNLVVVPREDLEAHIAERVAALPDLEQRQAEAKAYHEANMPSYERVIRALCDELGEEFDCITAGDPSFRYQNKQTLAWTFFTDIGHRTYIETDGRHLALDGTSRAVLAELSAPSEK